MRWGKSVAVLMGMVVMLSMRAGVAASDTPADTPQDTNAAPVRILVFGDSLSAEYGLPRGSGWVSHIEERLQQRKTAYQMRNASISGDTTSGGLNRMPAILRDFPPDIVILQLGANDGLRGLPVQQMKLNLTRMVELSRDAGAEVLLVGQHIPPNYGQRYAQQFHEAFGEVARESGAALVPFMLEAIALDPAMFQADGLHPTEAAQRLIAETMWPHLEAMLD